MAAQPAPKEEQKPQVPQVATGFALPEDDVQQSPVAQQAPASVTKNQASVSEEIAAAESGEDNDYEDDDFVEESIN